MKRRTSRLKRYTAFVPKSLKATQKVGKNITHKVKRFFGKTLKNTAKILNRTTARTIHSLTKRRRRH